MGRQRGDGMSIYSFFCVRGPGDPVSAVEICVAFDSEHDQTLEAVVGAFVDFLKGVSFSPDIIAKYINHELV